MFHLQRPPACQNARNGVCIYAMDPTPRLSPADVRAVAVEAGRDTRTVERYLRAEPQPSTTRAGIERALRALGFDSFIRTRACA